MLTYKIVRGDLHRHTEISMDSALDGTIWDLYRYALNAAAFDFIGVTEHNNGAWLDTDEPETRNTDDYIAGTRISLDSIVHEYNQGAPPESIVREFELLTLEQVYGAIAFYMAHQAKIEAYLRNSEVELEDAVLPLSETRPELYQRLLEARRRRTAKRP